MSLGACGRPKAFQHPSSQEEKVKYLKTNLSQIKNFTDLGWLQMIEISKGNQPLNNSY